MTSQELGSRHIFLSLRFGRNDIELVEKAGKLKDALTEHGWEVFLCDAHAGKNFGDEIVPALFKMVCMVAFISSKPAYGADCGGSFTTFHELKYAYENKRLIIPLVMDKGVGWPPSYPVGDDAGQALLSVAIPSSRSNIDCTSEFDVKWMSNKISEAARAAGGVAVNRGLTPVCEKKSQPEVHSSPAKTAKRPQTNDVAPPDNEDVKRQRTETGPLPPAQLHAAQIPPAQVHAAAPTPMTWPMGALIAMAVVVVGAAVCLQSGTQKVGGGHPVGGYPSGGSPGGGYPGGGYPRGGYPGVDYGGNYPGGDFYDEGDDY